MKIKVLGTGCTKCKVLEKATLEAVQKNGINATVTKEEDIVKIMEYGVMTTPALVVDEKVVVKGKLLSVDQIANLLKKQ